MNKNIVVKIYLGGFLLQSPDVFPYTARVYLTVNVNNYGTPHSPPRLVIYSRIAHMPLSGLCIVSCFVVHISWLYFLAHICRYLVLVLLFRCTVTFNPVQTLLLHLQ